MTKPEDIPQDIWDDLEGFRTQPFHWKGPEEVALLLAYAAKAEREACAQYCETFAGQFPEYPEFDEQHNCAMSLAFGIRNRDTV